MKRVDRSEKLKNKKLTSETVVKCSLHGIVRKDKFSVDLIKAIEKRVIACSKRTFNASIGLNLIIREAFNGIKDPTQAIIPKFWDQTFIRQLMLGTQSCSKPNQIITDLHSRYPSLLLHEERFRADSNIYCAAAIRLSTNIKNHLVINFQKFLRKYLYNASGLSKDEAVEALYKTCGWKRRKIIPEEVDEIKVRQCSNQLRYILGFNLDDESEIKEKWLKDNVESILRLFVFISRNLERREFPLFNILPICRIKSHFITIDTTVFIGIVQEIKMVNSSIENLETEYWNSVFNIDRIRGNDKTFTGTMDTDSLVVNVHFRKPKVLQDIEKKEIDLTDKRVIGVDPGRSNIFEMVEDLKDGSFKEYRLTRRHFYNASGILKARNKTNHWNLKIKNELEEISRASPKSMKMKNFIFFLETLNRTQDAMWTEYLKKYWKEQRFRLYGGKKRVFAKFLNQLGDPKDIVLAYGDGSFAPTGKGEMSVPTSNAFNECSKRFKTIVVDEFRTSKIYWKTGDILKTVVKQDKRDYVRGLLWYSSTIKSESKFVNRDLNAAINILNCATLPTRPIMLQRNSKNTKIVQQIGKTITR